MSSNAIVTTVSISFQLLDGYDSKCLIINKQEDYLHVIKRPS